MYMSQKEVLYTLEMKGNVEPGFTQLVWQKLEEQNKEFFQAYALRLQLRDQIALFNHLLEQQAQALQKGPGGAWARGRQPGPNAMGMHGSGLPGGLPRMGGGHGGLRRRAPPGGHGHGRAGHRRHGRLRPLGFGRAAGGAGLPKLPGGPGGLRQPALRQGVRAEARAGGGRAQEGGGGKKGAGGKKGDAGKGKAPSSNLGGAFDKTGNFKSVFSLSDLTAELGSQLATDGDVSLSLLAGITEDSIPADIRNGFKFGLPSGLTGGTMDNVFSLSDMGKLEAPLLDLDNEQDSQQHI